MAVSAEDMEDASKYYAEAGDEEVGTEHVAHLLACLNAFRAHPLANLRTIQGACLSPTHGGRCLRSDSIMAEQSMAWGDSRAVPAGAPRGRVLGFPGAASLMLPHRLLPILNDGIS